MWCISNFRQSYISKKAGRRAKLGVIWASRVSIQCIRGTFDTWVVKVILWSLGEFLIFDNLVSWKWQVVERNGVQFGHQGWVFSVYRILAKLNASGNSGVIRCISDFLVPRKRQVLEWKIHLDLYVIQFYVVIAFHRQAEQYAPGLLVIFMRAFVGNQKSVYSLVGKTIIQK